MAESGPSIQPDVADLSGCFQEKRTFRRGCWPSSDEWKWLNRDLHIILIARPRYQSKKADPKGIGLLFGQRCGSEAVGKQIQTQAPRCVASAMAPISRESPNSAPAKKITTVP